MARTISITQELIDKQRETFRHQIPDPVRLTYWCMINQIDKNLSKKHQYSYFKEEKVIIRLDPALAFEYREYEMTDVFGYREYQMPEFIDEVEPFKFVIPGLPERIYAKNS